jgi:malate synthase
MTTSLLLRKISAPQPELEVTAPVNVALAGVITLEAIAFLAALERRFGARRRQLLAARREHQRRLDAGLEQLDFSAETVGIRKGSWTIAPAPADLLDRRVEIIGPADRSTLVAALNSGAQTFVADFEDSFIPTWTNLLQGQIDLYDAVRRRIAALDTAAGKTRGAQDASATLIVRPRGWHMEEARVRLDGAPI